MSLFLLVVVDLLMKSIRKETNTKSKTFWLHWNLDTLISRIRKKITDLLL